MHTDSLQAKVEITQYLPAVGSGISPAFAPTSPRLRRASMKYRLGLPKSIFSTFSSAATV